MNGNDQMKETQGFVIATEDLNQEFTELKPHIYLPENTLVLHWFSVMNEVAVSTNKFGDTYLEILPKNVMNSICGCDETEKR